VGTGSRQTPTAAQERGEGGGWVWYCNVPAARLGDLLTDRQGRERSASLPPGCVRDHHLRELREAAARTLPPPLAAMVGGTAEPFVQAVLDIEVPRMAFGRVCLIGDAAFALRPHAAAGTAKAAADAWRLAEALEACGGDVVTALQRWEPGQLALGRDVLARTRKAGERTQVSGTWRIGDPLPFGAVPDGRQLLPGRSVMPGLPRKPIDCKMYSRPAPPPGGRRAGGVDIQFAELVYLQSIGCKMRLNAPQHAGVAGGVVARLRERILSNELAPAPALTRRRSPRSSASAASRSGTRSTSSPPRGSSG
jgi:hypothetical protein